MDNKDTVFALSSPAGRGAVAVVRLSGPRAGGILRDLSGRALPVPRQACLRRLTNPRNGEVTDQALVLWFPGPHSFTGEDLVELHIHGSLAVAAALFDALAEFEAVRPAEAGEFTRRAFENHKLDLSEVEGLADLIAAETEAQRRLALRQMEGALSDQSERWRQGLMRQLAHLEAWIDFPDEELPPDVLENIGAAVDDLIGSIDEYLRAGQGVERIRTGLEVAIFGRPNVGKSSLLNRIARRDAAIVSETAGTTRDVVEVRLDLGGYAVTLADTAGLRLLEGEGEATGSRQIEAEGMRRSRRRVAEADLTVAVFDGTDLSELGSEDQEILDLVDDRCVVVVNKMDLLGDDSPDVNLTDLGPAASVLPVSATTGAGMDRLMEMLEQRAVSLCGISDAAPVLTRVRHRQALTDCRDALVRAKDVDLLELKAEDLRLAQRALGRITGQCDVEDLLDIVFADFCIGK